MTQDKIVLAKKVYNRLLDEVGARNYDFFKWNILRKDLRYKKRDTKKFKVFFDAKGKPVDVNKILNTLLKDGAVSIEGLYTDQWVDQARKNLMKYVNEYKRGKIKQSGLWQKKFGYAEDLLRTGIIRFYNVADKVPEAKEFADNELLKYIGELYYQKKLRLQTVISQYNEVSKIPCRGYHLDSYIDQFKTFIYLCDVNKMNGPHTYVKGSHKNSDRVVRKLHKVLKDQFSGRNTTADDSTGLSDEEAMKLGSEELILTGKKGTVLLVDTRGIHQGGTLKRGERVVFNTYYYVD